MAWACNRCDQLHTQNPHECRNCGHGIFRPVSKEELKGISRQNSKPQPITPTATTGKQPEPEFTPSPDVNPDGSLKTNNSQEANPNATDPNIISRVLSWVGL